MPSASATNSDHVSHGRGRSKPLDDAIAASAIRLLGQLGPDRFSIEAVARDVGCSKASIYRRYGSKMPLIAEAARSILGPTIEFDGHSMLESTISARAETLAQPATLTAVLALMEAAARKSEVTQDVVDSALSKIRQSSTEALDAAMASGEIGPDADIPLLLDVISGTLILRTSIYGPEGSELIQRLATMLLNGVGRVH